MDMDKNSRGRVDDRIRHFDMDTSNLGMNATMMIRIPQREMILEG